jgi:S-adenosyl methyltransferase
MTRPSIARVYDYLLDGKDNFAADREVGEKIRQALPEVHLGVQAQRAVLRRVVRYLVGEAGLTQLIDIGSGLPTAGNVHEIAQSVEPATHVVYVDNDPIVLAHGRALLADSSVTAVIEGDVRAPEGILGDPELRRLIDFERPVGVLLCGIVHYIMDEEDPGGVLQRLYAGLPAGSHVFLHHLVHVGGDAAAAQAALTQGMGRGEFRSPAAIEGFLTGLDPVPPGLVTVPDWRPDADTMPTSHHQVLRLALAGVAVKR